MNMKDLVADAKQRMHASVETVRRDVNDHLKRMLKDHTVSEDDEKQAMAEVQKLTDHSIEQINEILKKKEAEIMEV
jgi:ribosome recycling factor